jgi:RHS repeat-associated protein
LGGMYNTHSASMHAALQGSSLIDFTVYEAANRFCASNLGRWHSPDPIGEKAVRLDDPQTWNMYAYVRDNPTTLTDPSGTCEGNDAVPKTTGGEMSGSRNEGLCQTRDLHAGESQGKGRIRCKPSGPATSSTTKLEGSPRRRKAEAEARRTSTTHESTRPT